MTQDCAVTAPARQRLADHKHQWTETLQSLFHNDGQRAERFHAECGELFLDYSKSHITETTRQLLCELAETAGLKEAIGQLVNGEHINNTEDRPALHTLLRSRSTPTKPLLRSYQQQIQQCQAQMAQLVEQLHQQRWTGHTGKAITHVVNIGIGGSDLGPRMVCEALEDYRASSIEVRFVANLDPSEILNTLKDLPAETTLFIVASKSFTTLETLSNAESARKWLLQNGCPMGKLPHHFVAVSSNIEKAVAFGIAEENIFPMWDWVGGRYSLWSAIGLPIAIQVGWDNFTQLLEGAEQMDQHFTSTSFDQNLPVLLALITYWYSQHWSCSNQAILPYSHSLKSFPMFLQQMDMESLGKSVSRSGDNISQQTGLVIWGTEECNGQHSFHQLLLQGTQTIPVDFIAFSRPYCDRNNQHTHLLASCLSQAQALLTGKSEQQAQQELIASGHTPEQAASIAPHKVIEGNRPSNTLLIEQLTPKTLGALTALYEHKVFTLSVLLGINAFDQWGGGAGQTTWKQGLSGPEDWRAAQQLGQLYRFARSQNPQASKA